MATQGLGEGIDIETIASRGGWANTTTPLEIYSHFQPARDGELARKLAGRLDGEAESPPSGLQPDRGRPVRRIPPP